MKFRVEYIGTLQDTAQVVARQIDLGNFVVGDRASLGGVRIRQWLSQPRKLRSDGTPDLEVFVFSLVTAADGKNFVIDQIVELTNASSGEEAI
jgi:hypothetical protein